MNIGKIRQLGWQPRHDFEQALKETVQWYLDHEDWWRHIKEKQQEFKRFYREQHETPDK